MQLNACIGSYLRLCYSKISAYFDTPFKNQAYASLIHFKLLNHSQKGLVYELNCTFNVCFVFLSSDENGKYYVHMGGVYIVEQHETPQNKFSLIFSL